MNGRVAFALLLMGFTSLVAQTLAIREFLITFYGTELTIGIILANWILLGAIGSALAGRAAKRPLKDVTLYALLQAGLTLYLPVSIFLIRTIKNSMGLVAGEGAGPLPVLISSFLILAPAGMMIGAQFPFGSAILARAGKDPQSSAGKVYILEGIGFMIGGPVFTYLLITSFNSFAIFFVLGLINAASALFLLKEERAKLGGRLLSVLMAALFLVIALCLFLASGDLNTLSINRQWKGQHIVKYMNSVYGNLTVSRADDQYTFFSNGIPVIAAPVPDMAAVEERVHFTMLAAKGPKNVLLIGGGAGGIIKEVLKYPVDKVTYVELDPALIQLVKSFPTPLTKEELYDPRVRIRYLDGRRFLRLAADTYDVIMVNLPMPSTLQLNRFYTREFFLNVKERLGAGGVFSFTLPGSLSYISREQARLNSSVLRTLNGVLWSTVIPGDNNLYLASRTALKTDPDAYLARLDAYGVRTVLMNRQYFDHRLDPSLRAWFAKETLRISGVRKNTDLLPSGMFYGIWYWSTLFTKKMGGFFAAADKLNIFSLLMGLGIVAALVMALAITRKRPEKVCSSFVIGSTGFVGMSLSLIIMYAYQSFYGYIFQQLAMLVTSFMAGLALASFAMNRKLGAVKDTCGAFFLIEFACLGCCAAVVPALLYLNANPRPELAWIFFAMSAIAGSFIGFEFPLANKVYGGVHTASSSGALYAVDLAGSWAAALLISLALMPVIGMVHTCLFLAAVKAFSIMLLLISSRD